MLLIWLIQADTKIKESAKWQLWLMQADLMLLIWLIQADSLLLIQADSG
jgi:hypothetical protein